MGHGWPRPNRCLGGCVSEILALSETQPPIRALAKIEAPSFAAASSNLDFLRTVAVLFVVCFHIGLVFVKKHLPGGFHDIGQWGVLIFFVHTSFVLMWSLDRQQRGSRGGPLAAAFWTRRAFRIYPLAMIAVLVVVSLHLPVADLRDGHGEMAPMTVGEIASNFLLLQNITRSESVLAPLWSLPYEVEMYLLLPVLFVLVRRISAAQALAWWLLAAIFSQAWELIPHLRAFDLPAYVPCFLAGIVGYRMSRAIPRELPFLIWPCTVAAASVLYLLHHDLWTGWICALLLGLVLPLCKEGLEGIWSEVCRLVARYSYGIYLSHYIVIWFAFVRLAGQPMPIRVMAFVGAIGIIPVALYHLVEEPMIRAGALLARRWN
jgi:peptidoglycan/LPS O-acetylase OafA/YrhL